MDGATNSAASPKQAFWLTAPGLLLGGALLSGLVAWWLIAWPVVTLSNQADHAGHFWITFVHMIGGTTMLFLGAANLYLGLTRRTGKLHQRVGRWYLGLGAFGALAALFITLSPAHKPASSPVLTNSSISLSMLALAWLAFSALGWRAALNRRFGSHRDWMIRSYVLTWSFVFCRLASRVPEIGDLGNGAAFIWLSWVGPLIICEIGLQWQAGARQSR